MRFPWIVAALVLGLQACAPEEIVIATANPDAADGGPDALDEEDTGTDDGGLDALDEAEHEPFVTCRTNDECEAGTEFCAKATCMDLQGRCERRPLFCDAVINPTCGCDGITYLNDCWRKVSGAIAATRPECGNTGIKCGAPTQMPCPGDSFCAKLISGGPSCPPDPHGTCWSVPPSCEGGMWSPCQGSGPCTDFCGAIRSEKPFRRNMRCPPPP